MVPPQLIERPLVDGPSTEGHVMSTESRFLARVLLPLVMLTACGSPEGQAANAAVDTRTLVDVDGRTLVHGSWLMTNPDGTESILVFDRDSSMTITTNGDNSGFPGAQYTMVEAPNSNYRLYLRVRDRAEPFALIRVNQERLILCMVDTYERTLGGMRLGQLSRVEWPASTEETTCDVLRRLSAGASSDTAGAQDSTRGQ